MSKHNYSQYSSKKNGNVAPVAKAPEVKMEFVEPIKPALVNETVDTVALPNTVKGVVADCSRLNVRMEPDLFADIVCALDVMSEVMIDVDKSVEDWFYICTATGIEGYCMRRYVDAYL